MNVVLYTCRCCRECWTSDCLEYSIKPWKADKETFKKQLNEFLISANKELWQERENIVKKLDEGKKMSMWTNLRSVSKRKKEETVVTLPLKQAQLCSTMTTVKQTGQPNSTGHMTSCIPSRIQVNTVLLM